MEQFDRIIIGAGLYGLYGARASAAKGMRVLVLEYDNQAFSRATYINQARVHMGYHYPRSLSTAMKSAGCSPGQMRRNSEISAGRPVFVVTVCRWNGISNRGCVTEPS